MSLIFLVIRSRCIGAGRRVTTFQHFPRSPPAGFEGPTSKTRGGEGKGKEGGGRGKGRGKGKGYY